LKLSEIATMKKEIISIKSSKEIRKSNQNKKILHIRFIEIENTAL
jgi:hypothetical protein